MGYGNWARSPEEVQRVNGVRTDFDTAVKRYESIKPLQGKRKVLNVRPSGERSRAWERIVKVSDTEYYLTCTQYAYNDNDLLKGGKDKPEEQRRVITLKQEGEVETIVVHKSRWGLASLSMFYFYDYNLPLGMSMEKYYANNYVRVAKADGGYNWYTLDKGDITFYRPKGGTIWTPLVVHREVKHSLDRKKTKVIREKLKAFSDYAKVMFPLVEANGNHWGSVLDKNWEEFVTLSNPDEIPDNWLGAVSAYKQRLNRYDWSTRTYNAKETGLIPKIQKEAYRIEKPFAVEVVPLGERSRDPYKGWL